MAKKRVIQGRGKERGVSLTAIDSGEVTPNQQPVRIYTPENPEYQRYSELLRGFFERFTRWDAILTQKQYRIDYSDSSFRRNDKSSINAAGVAQTPQGLMLYPSTEDAYLYTRDPRYVRQDTVMLVQAYHEDLDPSVNIGFFMGPAGKQVFVDPDGEQLGAANVAICVSSYGFKEVAIWAAYPDEKIGPSYAETNERYRPPHIKFKLEADGSLEISPVTLYGIGSTLMPISYATHLVNTIDALIPNTVVSPTPQTGQRASQELLIPPAHPGRRPAEQ